ncbi:MAG: radical SAM protein [Deltaproteobacteria bacterium]|nr:radical SAM protein [Deltaproteobacteria bacterium]
MAKREFPLRMVAWELTRSCNLSCLHCRASAIKERDEQELTTDECKMVIDSISSFSSPVIILTGGEPLLRNDIFEIISYANERGLYTVLATNGTFISKEIARTLKKLNIRRVSLSIDGKDSQSHDHFRGVNGSFEYIVNAAKIMKEENLPFQINTTVTYMNINDLENIYALAISLGASAWHVFMLLPVGRGKNIKEKVLKAEEYEETLRLIYTLERKRELEIKVTCGPQYYRILKENGETLRSSGCLAGKSFMFISHTGVTQPCGYLEIPCGDVKTEGVEHVWKNSEVFLRLRDYSQYKGKCGRCRYLDICGGCRARSYEEYGDFMEGEPYCTMP